MKILVVPATMDIGGSEINAIESAAALHRAGHNSVVVGHPGPLVDRARGLGLRVIEIRVPRRARPNPLRALALRRVIRAEKPDLIHAYESHSAGEAFLALGTAPRCPMVQTFYGMEVDEYLPRLVPTIAGTRQVEEDLREAGVRAPVFCIEPPVDMAANTPDATDGRRQRSEWGAGESDEVVVIACRLDLWMKMDSLLDTIGAVDLLAVSRPIRLFIVGDGPARTILENEAELVNRRHGRTVVSLVGSALDPVPAYRAADVVVGMGTSILRALAVGRPSIVSGQRGYAETVSPTTVEGFLRWGFWGVGEGTSAAPRLAGLLAEALDLGSEEAVAQGRWSREFVDGFVGLEGSTVRLLAVLEEAQTWAPERSALRFELARVPLSGVKKKVRDRLPRHRGQANHAQYPPTRDAQRARGIGAS